MDIIDDYKNHIAFDSTYNLRGVNTLDQVLLEYMKPLILVYANTPFMEVNLISKLFTVIPNNSLNKIKLAVVQG